MDLGKSMDRRIMWYNIEVFADVNRYLWMIFVY
jgi:hypothetical protein